MCNPLLFFQLYIYADIWVWGGGKETGQIRQLVLRGKRRIKLAELINSSSAFSSVFQCGHSPFWLKAFCSLHELRKNSAVLFSNRFLRILMKQAAVYLPNIPNVVCSVSAHLLALSPSQLHVCQTQADGRLYCKY